MTSSQETSQEQQQKMSDKEINFRAQQQKYERMLEQERQARIELQKQMETLANERRSVPQEEEDDNSEPYVDNKKLNKKLAKFSEQTQKQTQVDIQRAVVEAREEAKREAWLENNADFYEVLNHAEKLAQRSPALAKTILNMPDTFERQKLVYQNIKEFGLHKPEEKKASIQDKVDANRRSPFYQPTNVGAAPYQSQGDFSASGQEQSYKKMKELQSRLRIG